MRIVGITVVGACIALVALYVWLTRGEIQENRYATFAEAHDSQGRGWLPTALPRSATEIHEWYDLDTNLCYGSFRFDPRERSSIEATLGSGLRRTIRVDPDPSFASPLPREPGREELARKGFEFYSEQGFDLAISWKEGIAYFWNSSS